MASAPHSEQQRRAARARQVYDDQEARYARLALVALEQSPVAGAFDLEHLRATHRAIFALVRDRMTPWLAECRRQAADDTDRTILETLQDHLRRTVRPGELRAPVASWAKHRRLSDGAGHWVGYSRMGAADRERLQKSLAQMQPTRLQALDAREAARLIARVYGELDYVHPFYEGNSRVLRAFTRQWARAAGYDLRWREFFRSDHERDRLLIARDRSATGNGLADAPHANLEAALHQTRRALAWREDLPDVLADKVVASAAYAFENLPREQVLRRHPELEVMYQRLAQHANALRVRDGGHAPSESLELLRARLFRQLRSAELPARAAARRR